MEIESDYGNLSNPCPECNGKVISLHEKGERVCEQCGLVINERIVDISHSGKRAFTKQEKESRERTGSPISILLPDMGLSTIIDKNSIRSPLPTHVKKTAIRLYIEAFKRKLLRGRSINGMVAACLYFACRERKIPRTLQEILDQTTISAKNVRRCYRTLIRELNLKVPSTDPISLIPRFIADLELDFEAENATIKIINIFTSKFSTSGKDPKGLCAGALYLVCKMRDRKISQKEIANLVGVTEVTLRSRFKELTKTLKIMV